MDEDEDDVIISQWCITNDELKEKQNDINGNGSINEREEGEEGLQRHAVKKFMTNASSTTFNYKYRKTPKNFAFSSLPRNIVQKAHSLKPVLTSFNPPMKTNKDNFPNDFDFTNLNNKSPFSKKYKYVNENQVKEKEDDDILESKMELSKFHYDNVVNSMSEAFDNIRKFILIPGSKISVRKVRKAVDVISSLRPVIPKPLTFNIVQAEKEKIVSEKEKKINSKSINSKEDVKIKKSNENIITSDDKEPQEVNNKNKNVIVNNAQVNNNNDNNKEEAITKKEPSKRLRKQQSVLLKLDKKMSIRITKKASLPNLKKKDSIDKQANKEESIHIEQLATLHKKSSFIAGKTLDGGNEETNKVSDSDSNSEDEKNKFVYDDLSSDDEHKNKEDAFFDSEISAANDANKSMSKEKDKEDKKNQPKSPVAFHHFFTAVLEMEEFDLYENNKAAIPVGQIGSGPSEIIRKRKNSFYVPFNLNSLDDAFNCHAVSQDGREHIVYVEMDNVGMVARYFNEDHIEYDEMELDTLSFLEPPLINNIGSISYQGQTNPSQDRKNLIIHDCKKFSTIHKPHTQRILSPSGQFRSLKYINENLIDEHGKTYDASDLGKVSIVLAPGSGTLAHINRLSRQFTEKNKFRNNSIFNSSNSKIKEIMPSSHSVSRAKSMKRTNTLLLMKEDLYGLNDSIDKHNEMYNRHESLDENEENVIEEQDEIESTHRHDKHTYHHNPHQTKRKSFINNNLVVDSTKSMQKRASVVFVPQDIAVASQTSVKGRGSIVNGSIKNFVAQGNNDYKSSFSSNLGERRKSNFQLMLSMQSPYQEELANASSHANIVTTSSATPSRNNLKRTSILLANPPLFEDTSGHATNVASTNEQRGNVKRASILLNHPLHLEDSSHPNVSHRGTSKRSSILLSKPDETMNFSGQKHQISKRQDLPNKESEGEKAEASFVFREESLTSSPLIEKISYSPKQMKHKPSFKNVHVDGEKNSSSPNEFMKKAPIEEKRTSLGSHPNMENASIENINNEITNSNLNSNASQSQKQPIYKLTFRNKKGSMDEKNSNKSNKMRNKTSSVIEGSSSVDKEQIYENIRGKAASGNFLKGTDEKLHKSEDLIFKMYHNSEDNSNILDRRKESTYLSSNITALVLESQKVPNEEEINTLQLNNKPIVVGDIPKNDEIIKIQNLVESPHSINPIVPTRPTEQTNNIKTNHHKMSVISPATNVRKLIEPSDSKNLSKSTTSPIPSTTSVSSKKNSTAKSPAPLFTFNRNMGASIATNPRLSSKGGGPSFLSKVGSNSDLVAIGWKRKSEIDLKKIENKDDEILLDDEIIFDSNDLLIDKEEFVVDKSETVKKNAILSPRIKNPFLNYDDDGKDEIGKESVIESFLNDVKKSSPFASPSTNFRSING